MRPVSVALVVALAACGGDAEQPPRTDTAPPADAAAPTPTPDTSVDTTAGLSGETTASPSVGTREAARSPAAGRRGPPDSERLYTIQVAAFVDQGSAEEWVEELRSHGWPVWSSLAEVRDRLFHRVRVGALPTVEEATRLGNAVSERYGWPVWVAPVTPADRPPADVVDATRDALGRS